MHCLWAVSSGLPPPAVFSTSPQAVSDLRSPSRAGPVSGSAVYRIYTSRLRPQPHTVAYAPEQVFGQCSLTPYCSSVRLYLRFQLFRVVVVAVDPYLVRFFPTGGQVLHHCRPRS